MLFVRVVEAVIDLQRLVVVVAQGEGERILVLETGSIRGRDRAERGSEPRHGAGRSVVDVPVVLVVQVGQPPGKRAVAPGIERGPHAASVVVRDADLDIGLELLGGIAGNEVDGATRRIATEQGALWAAQHLEPTHVRQVEHRS